MANSKFELRLWKFLLILGGCFLSKICTRLGSMSVIIKFSRLAKGRSVHGQLYSCCQYAKSWIEWRWLRFFHDIIKMQETSWSELTHQMQTQARKRYMKTEISNLITLCSVDSCLSTEVIPFAILILRQHYWYVGTYLNIYIKQQHFGTLLFLLLGGVRKKRLRKFFQMDGPFSANLVSISAITVYELECHDFLDCLLVWNCANSSWAIRTSYSICSLAKF